MRTGWSFLALLMACDGGTAAKPASTVAADAKVAGPASGKNMPPPPPAGWQVAGTTPNAFFGAGTPTFVVGTRGGANEDRNTAGQARFIAGAFFPAAEVIDDASVTANGKTQWPARPVLYGGPHVHESLAAVVDELPFEMTADSLRIGGQTMQGPGIQLITVVPGRQPSWPEFLLYAGTGLDGVAEINALSDGSQPIVIGDAFGLLTTGRWEVGDDGALQAKLEPKARRIEWRPVARMMPGGVKVDFLFPGMLEADPADDAVIDAGLRGLGRARERLELTNADALAVYVYPDPRSKQSLTNPGDGHAAPAAKALHVLRGDAAHLGALESLMAHEGTHVLLRSPWGAPGTAWMGEGIAVWASGSYAGQTLDAWATRVEPLPVADLLGRAFFTAPEAQKYPLAGLFVDVAVAEIGIVGVRDHLYRATPASWEAACVAAGTTAAALQAALSRRLAR